MSREDGTGTLSAAIGLTVAFTMLLGTVQVVARLHRTTVVTALATDAAHRVAEQGDGAAADGARRQADGRLHHLLGPEADIRWSTSGWGPVIQITVPAPSWPRPADPVRRRAGARWEQAG